MSPEMERQIMDGFLMERQILDAFLSAQSVFIDNGGTMRKACRVVVTIVESDNSKQETDLKSGQAQFEVSMK